ncbi:MAG: hypothetical protein WC307_03935 [Candidatus Nanoarchaeia archaeon]|jgi:DNA-binding transcriptional MerR regulator
MVFGKKKEESKENISDVPIQAVISMKERGFNNEQVIEQLKSQGYSLQAIRDALTQADIKKSAVGPTNPELPPLPGEEMPMPDEPEMPARGGPNLNTPMSFAPPESIKDTKVEEMERILEEIVDERWKDVTGKFNELESSKIKNETMVTELRKRVSELSNRIDEISNVVMGRVDEYKRTMEDVDVEIKALEKVMQKLVPSMAEQVKELKDVVGGLRGIRPLSE